MGLVCLSNCGASFGRLKWLSSGSDKWGLELFGNFFIYMSDTWIRLIHRLGSAGAVDRSTYMWSFHVGSASHSELAGF